MFVSKVQRLRAEVTAWAAGFDAATVSASVCAEVVREVAAIEASCAAVKVAAAARVAESGVWRQAGEPSAATWLARATGTTATAAEEQLATGKRLGRLPGVATAAGRGELSAAQTAAIADAAALNPQAAAELVAAAAGESLQGLRERCRAAKAAVLDDDMRRRQIQRRRRLRAYTDADGARVLTLTGPAEVVATVESRVDAETDRLFHAARAEGRREPREAYTFDALVALVTRNDDVQASETKPGRRRRKANQPAYLTLLRADLDSILAGAVRVGDICEIPGVGPIPALAVRELLGESIVKLVLTRGEQVCNVTHLGRGPTVAQLVAKLWHNPRCSVTGCDRLDVEVDHRLDWATSRHTRLDELDLLCRHHHRLKTRRGWALVAGTERRPMVPPHDPRHPAFNTAATTPPTTSRPRRTRTGPAPPTEAVA